MTTHVIPFGSSFLHSEVPLGIPGLATDELRITFLQATDSLCPDIQRKIWKEVLHCTAPISPPPAPKKACPVIYERSSVSLPRNLFQPIVKVWPNEF